MTKEELNKTMLELWDINKALSKYHSGKERAFIRKQFDEYINKILDTIFLSSTEAEDLLKEARISMQDSIVQFLKVATKEEFTLDSLSIYHDVKIA
ncbi:MAG: hypothetical protein FWE36_08575 [Erysipelotrichales bacterium]|nr:hypothetical protein [Erysipelotrichales bacterium]